MFFIEAVENSGWDEHVILRNDRSSVVSLSGWSLCAGNSGQTFTLRSYPCALGTRVTWR
ncbi:MAG: hypothetical protein M3281_05530 [Chloroflexota bacterium]|nr:hypothetical protein [Chloroflexota bacterium]